MQTKRQELFTTVRTEGSILPPDLLQRVVDEEAAIAGLAPADYHLSGERINEAVSRSWNRLQGAWAAFRQAGQNLPQQDAGTSLAREKWLLPLFQELGYGRLQTSKTIEIDGKSYAISHRWQHTPIHLVGFRVDLDKRTAGVAGAARSSPHSLVQELLNREAAHLWGIVSNGLRLRILRDNKSLTRQAFVEFDLQAMMDGQVYPDFKLLWLLCHQSRVEAPPDSRPEQCWLEKWSQTAIKQGTRALDGLRDGVQRAIESLGRGFLSHPANRVLRERLQSGQLDKQDYYRQLLRLVYRLMFLFVAEDRGLLFDPASEPAARQRYTRFYSTQRLRDLAGKMRGTPHADLYEGMGVVFRMLDQAGCPELGLPALGSRLWSAEALGDLAGLRLANRDLLDAVRQLAFTLDGQARRPVDYKNLGSEELGSIYESLLELHPQINAEAGTFELATAAGHERKTTGSYYTPTSLVNCLLDSALEPVLADAVKGGPGYADRGQTPEQRVLSLKVCDPACGSGHFLIAAAHRIAKRLAAVRSGDEEPAPEIYRHALRDVIGHCIYGVDINPMAVELCKVSLWMEALEPGRPLSFLDHRIQVGNSLIGATPALLARGIPDEAFEPIEGDDKALCKGFRKQNKDERKGQGMLFSGGHRPWEHLGNLAVALTQLDAVSDETIDGIRLKQRSYDELVHSGPYETGRLLADAWCAAFVWKKTKEFDYPITEAVFRRIEKNPSDLAPWARSEIRRLAGQHHFFHWHLAFPEIFGVLRTGGEPTNNTGWTGGFDVVVGNPPWERLKFESKVWFAGRAPEIAHSPSAIERLNKSSTLATVHPELARDYAAALRHAETESHFIAASGRFVLVAGGDINTYAVFTELAIGSISATGRVGVIVPSAITSTLAYQPYISELVEAGKLVSFFDFENRHAFFQDVHSSYRFCLLTVCGHRQGSALCGFVLRSLDDLKVDGRTFVLRASDLCLFSPNTHAFPVFQTQRDAAITRAIYNKVPVLLKDGCAENPWDVGIYRMIDATESGNILRDDEDWFGRGTPVRDDWSIVENGETWLRVYEGKMIDMFNHRFASSYTEGGGHRSGKAALSSAGLMNDPAYSVQSRYWVEKGDVEEKLQTWTHKWLLAFMDVCSASNERTMITAILPLAGATKSIRLITKTILPAGTIAALCANFGSIIFDYVTRQAVSGLHLSEHIVKQLPVLPPATYARTCPWLDSRSRTSLQHWVLNRILELTYTAWDLASFGVECDFDGPPFIWDEERRFLIRCELDAAFFHLYGISRDDADYILETFPIVKRKDIEKHGRYRTKDTILEIYDRVAAAMQSGKAYQTQLDPLPGPPANADGTFAPLPAWEEGQPRPANWPVHIHPPRHVRPSQPVAPTAPAIVTAPRELDITLVLRAFADVRQGYSPDYVVACPEANARFLQRVRQLGVGGADADINHALMNARKASKLKGQPTEVEYRLSAEYEPWIFASEWAMRHLQRLLVQESDRLVTLDDILCNPSQAARFDEIVTRIKPGFAAVDYRWAALGMRKNGKSKPAARDLKVKLERQMTLDEAMGGLPHGPGLYLIRASTGAIYVNHAQDLAHQLDRHKEIAGDLLVPDWLTQGVGHASALSIADLTGIRPEKLREVRISGVAEYRPYLNLLDLEGAA